MQGRIPLGMAHFRDLGEDHLASAIEEQELSHLGLGFLDRLKVKLVAACEDGQVTALELAELLKGIGNARAVVARQLEYDVRDEQMGREINVLIGQVIKTRPTAKQRAAR